MIGGGGEKVTLRIVAEHAAFWHSFAYGEVYRRKAEVLAGHCAAVGRDPSEIVHVLSVPAGNLERAEDHYRAGVTHLTIGLRGDGHGYDLGPLRELIAWRDAVR
jgi:alkanesulfonate monooxygenase SsuD/methylene tetrahydromethanopterin reductase-like flavin-dependent oxidoreductase (luciferase family)